MKVGKRREKGKWKERDKDGGSTTCKVRGQTERRDIQETDEKNELGDKRGRGGKKMEWLRDIASAKSKTNDKNKKDAAGGK